MQIPYFQTSLMVADPEPGLEYERLGSDSQVTAPLNLRMYLYSKLVLAGMAMVTVTSEETNSHHESVKLESKSE